MPLISVVLPVKNGSRFIQKAIQSFLDQSIIGFSKELIIVNDGSEDDTQQIVEDLASIHPEVSIYKNDGSGIIDALQCAYRFTQGEYISRMDADDVMPAHKLQTLVDILQTSNVQVATGKVKYFHLDKNEIGDGFFKYQEWLNSLVDKQKYYEEIYKECVVASPNWMIRRVDFDGVGAFIGEYPEDYDLVFRWYQYGLKIMGSTHITHHWYDHANRTSRNDDHYFKNSFFDLKVRYFLQLDKKPDRDILIYGAGYKGKTLAKMFLERNEKIVWCSNNEKKVGKKIYEVTLISDQENIESMNCQIIVAIAVPEDQVMIENRLSQAGLIKGEDYFFFC